MDQYSNFPENNGSQEIDLVDVVVVLWRRKLTIVLTTVLGMTLAMYIIATSAQTLNVSAVFFVGEAAVITEEVSLAEALAGKKEGRISTELLMEPVQSQILLSSIYLPRAIAKQLANNEGKYLQFESEISIDIGNKDANGQSQINHKAIRLSAITTEDFVSDYKAIFNAALAELADKHNQVYKRHQALTQRQIKTKTQELDAHLDARAAASGKQLLLGRRLSNQISQREHKDESLNMQIDLMLQRTITNAKNTIKKFNHQRPILAAKREIARFKESNLRKNNNATRTIVNTKASIDKVQIKLDRLDVLGDHYVARQKELTSILRMAEEDRSGLRSQLGSKNSTSTLVTEAIIAVDSRIARYEAEISEFEQQLQVELPTERLLVEKNIESLNRKLAAEEEDFALAIQMQKVELSILEEDLAITNKDQDTNLASLEDSLATAIHNERVSKLNRTFTQEKLDNETEEIKTAISGYDATYEAKTLRLNSAIDGLQVVLDQSTPSEILASATSRPEQSQSPTLVGLIIVMFSGVIGFALAFIFELIDKAKTRIA